MSWLLNLLKFPRKYATSVVFVAGFSLMMFLLYRRPKLLLSLANKKKKKPSIQQSLMIIGNDSFYKEQELINEQQLLALSKNYVVYLVILVKDHIEELQIENLLSNKPWGKEIKLLYTETLEGPIHFGRHIEPDFYVDTNINRVRKLQPFLNSLFLISSTQEQITDSDRFESRHDLDDLLDTLIENDENRN